MKVANEFNNSFVVQNEKDAPLDIEGFASTIKKEFIDVICDMDKRVKDFDFAKKVNDKIGLVYTTNVEENEHKKNIGLICKKFVSAFCDYYTIDRDDDTLLSELFDIHEEVADENTTNGNVWYDDEEDYEDIMCGFITEVLCAFGISQLIEDGFSRDDIEPDVLLCVPKIMEDIDDYFGPGEVTKDEILKKIWIMVDEEIQSYASEGVVDAKSKTGSVLPKNVPVVIVPTQEEVRKRILDECVDLYKKLTATDSFKDNVKFIDIVKTTLKNIKQPGLISDEEISDYLTQSTK